MLPPVSQASAPPIPSTPAPAASANAATYAASWLAPAVPSTATSGGNLLSQTTGGLLSVVGQSATALGSATSGVLGGASGLVGSALSAVADASRAVAGGIDTALGGVTETASTVAGNASSLVASATNAPLAQVSEAAGSETAHLGQAVADTTASAAAPASHEMDGASRPIETIFRGSAGEPVATAGKPESALSSSGVKLAPGSDGVLEEGVSGETSPATIVAQTQAAKTVLSAEQLLALANKSIVSEAETAPRQPADTQDKAGLTRSQSPGSPIRFDIPDTRPTTQPDLASSPEAVAQGAMTVASVPHDEVETHLGLSQHMLVDGAFKAEVLRAPAGESGDRYVVVMNGAASPSIPASTAGDPGIHAEKAIEIGKVIARADPDGRLDVAFADASNGPLAALAARAADRQGTTAARPA